jgi:hypothetical protein
MAATSHEIRRGEEVMKIRGNEKRVVLIGVALFAVAVFLGGCTASIHYSYDPAADFSAAKSYSWDTGGAWTYTPSPLIEKTVRYYADQSFKDRGFTLTSDRPDLLVSMYYETEYFDPYKVRTLTLYVSKGPNKVRIWQGTAKGPINADAASPELAEAVQKIMENFPPQ